VKSSFKNYRNELLLSFRHVFIKIANGINFFNRDKFFNLLTRSLTCYFYSSNSNYGPILYHFRDKARYWSTTAIISYPTCIRRPPL